MTSYLTFGLLLIVANVSGQLEESRKRFEDVYDYVSELRERSDTTLQYMTRIQQIFCPEQPICDEGQTDGIGNDTFLSKNLYIGNERMSVEDLKYLVGVCCLPCFCSDRCSEYDNCCLSKDLASVITSGVVKSECITATAKSYQRIIAEAGLMYLMINRCFRNDTDITTISKCESPDQYMLGDTIPVTSLTTGRTYWNTHCAKCNADADDVIPWNSTAIFDRFVLHIPTGPSMMIPQSPEEIYTYLLRSFKADIIYTPPVPMQHKVCLRDPLVCTDQENELASENDIHSFFFDACQKYSSPVLIGFPREADYKNIFCFFCQRKVSNSRPSCEADRVFKFSPGQVTSLLNYRKLTDDEHGVGSTQGPDMAGGLRDKCVCNQVYDTYINECRPLFCPPGEFRGVCQCVKLMTNITGMRMFLRLKVEPQTGQALPSTEAKRRKMRIALRKNLTTTSKGNDVDIYAAFVNTNSTRPYHFVIATVTSTPGNDIKEATKPFLDYLDDSYFMEISFNKTKLMARLTNRVEFWYVQDGTNLFKAKEIKGNLELTQIYLKESLRKPTSFTWMLKQGIYQILSPVLFCSQVQLDDNEFEEKDGMIQVNTTAPTTPIYDYIRVDDNHVRVCVDDYLQQPTRVSSGTEQNLKTVALLCLSIICKYFLIP